MGDSLDEFFCSAAGSSRQCTHPAANACRAAGRITSDNIPLSETKLRPAIGPPLSRGSRLRWAMMDTLTRAGTSLGPAVFRAGPIDVETSHRGAGFGERERDGAADAAARPGHDGDLFRKRTVLGARRHDHAPFALLARPPR